MNIAQCTVSQFGLEQARAYRDGLLATLNALAEHPMMGSDQGHIRPHLLRHVYKPHSIHYRLAPSGPTIMLTVVQLSLGPKQDPLQSL